MINNFNDGMLWGMLPVILMSLFFDATDIGQLVAVYPIIWGVGQLFTGKLGDIYSKKTILIIGMLLQGIAIMILPKGNFYWHFFLIAFFIGLGTALVYPNFLAAAAEHASIRQRAEIIGFFRFWRDMGYAIGALFSGIIADSLGVNYAFYFVGILTVVSGFIILFRMPEKAS